MIPTDVQHWELNKKLADVCIVNREKTDRDQELSTNRGTTAVVQKSSGRSYNTSTWLGRSRIWVEGRLQNP